MGFFKKIFEKLNQGFFYVVDNDTFRAYMDREERLCIQGAPEAGADLNIYVNGEKHRLQIWNDYDSENEEDRQKGYVVYFDEKEYATVNDMLFCELPDLPGYFKIELNLADDVELNAYKESHPELRVEDFSK